MYAGVDPYSHSANSQTAYKWSFASNKTNISALQAARADVRDATYGLSSSTSAGPSGSGVARIVGPTLPSHSDMVLAREAADEYEATEREYKRKRDRTEAKDRLEDVVGPREVGKERLLEKKRERRDNDKAFREKGDDGFPEADEGTLMGGGDSFKERYVLMTILLFDAVHLFTRDHLPHDAGTSLRYRSYKNCSARCREEEVRREA